MNQNLDSQVLEKTKTNQDLDNQVLEKNARSQNLDNQVLEKNTSQNLDNQVLEKNNKPKLGQPSLGETIHNEPKLGKPSLGKNRSPKLGQYYQNLGNQVLEKVTQTQTWKTKCWKQEHQPELGKPINANTGERCQQTSKVDLRTLKSRTCTNTIMSEELASLLTAPLCTQQQHSHCNRMQQNAQSSNGQQLFWTDCAVSFSFGKLSSTNFRNLSVIEICRITSLI